MSVSEIANSLVAICRAGKFDEAYDTLFAPDARSIEGTGDVAAGLEAVKGKGAAWDAQNEIKEFTVSDPYIGGDQFAVHFAMQFTNRASGQPIQMEEIGVYTVRDGKIIEERFLYGK